MVEPAAQLGARYLAAAPGLNTYFNTEHGLLQFVSAMGQLAALSGRVVVWPVTDCRSPWLSGIQPDFWGVESFQLNLQDARQVHAFGTPEDV